MAAVYGTDCRHPASGWSGTSALHGIWHESDEKADSTLRLSQRQRVGCCSADVSISIPLVSRISSLSGGGTITTTGRTRKRKSERATERAALAQCFLRERNLRSKGAVTAISPSFCRRRVLSHCAPFSWRIGRLFRAPEWRQPVKKYLNPAQHQPEGEGGGGG